MDLPSVFQAAVADSDNGATDVERWLIRTLLDHRGNWDHEMLLQGAVLIQTHSVMANLRRLAATFREAQGLDEIERGLLERQAVLGRLGQLLADAGFELVMPRTAVVTISRSSAVEAVLVGAFNRGWRGRVVVLDGTSAGCGTTQADRLEGLGFDVRSLPDGAMMEVLEGSSGESLVLVGADAIGPRRIINAQGTGLLLEAALRREIHTVVVADTGKDIGHRDVSDLVKSSRIQREAGPGRAWRVFEAFSRDLMRERVSEWGRALEPE